MGFLPSFYPNTNWYRVSRNAWQFWVFLRDFWISLFFFYYIYSFLWSRDMLEPLLEQLNSKLIVLASGSPRRSNILRKIVSSIKVEHCTLWDCLYPVFILCWWSFQGLKFTVVPSTFEENLDKSQFNHPKDYVLENAKQKALEVTRRLLEDNDVII